MLTNGRLKIDSLTRTPAQCPIMADSDQPVDLLSLAPAAGAGIGKLIAAELLKRPDFMPAMIEAAMGGLRATRSYYDKGSQSVVSEPDCRVQVQTLFGLLAHMEGDPVKRIIHEIKKSGIDPLEALDSPAAVQAAERMVAGARAKLRRKGVGMKAAEVVDVE